MSTSLIQYPVRVTMRQAYRTALIPPSCIHKMSEENTYPERSTPDHIILRITYTKVSKGKSSTKQDHPSYRQTNGHRQTLLLFTP